jgi:WhiB family redox-sensing transcriptional regulator
VNGGRLFYTDVDELGTYALDDFVRHRRASWAVPKTAFIRSFHISICFLFQTPPQWHRCNYNGGVRRIGEEYNVEIVELMSGMEDRGWQARANCMGVDPDLFFPERGASTREAKEVCRGCVAREDCLEYALDNGEKFGIWGGMSERERRRLRRARAIERRAQAS